MSTLRDRLDRELQVLAPQIAEERARHEALGWTADHDRGHARELRAAAGVYYSQALVILNGASEVFPWPPPAWPWADRYFRPSMDWRRNLVKCGALRLAADDAERQSADDGGHS